MADLPPVQSEPPAPGWWLASDGRWYPPQPAPVPPPPIPTPSPTQPPPATTTSRKGCLLVAAVVGVVLFVLVSLAVVAVWRFGSAVKDVADSVTVGDVRCPDAGHVSDVVGSPVELATSGSVVVAAGCSYTARAGGGAEVSIVSGPGLAFDGVMADLEREATANGTTTTPIPAGDGGRAFGAPTRSAAATRSAGRVVEVDVSSRGTQPIGDRRDAAVALLEDFLDLN